MLEQKQVLIAKELQEYVEKGREEIASMVETELKNVEVLDWRIAYRQDSPPDIDLYITFKIDCDKCVYTKIERSYGLEGLPF
jgi:hypothetical protein